MLPRPSMRENFRCKIFLESEKGSHTIFYGTTGQKTLDRKSWYPLIMHEFYSIPQNFWNTEVFSVVFFYYCETKIFDKNVIPSPSYPWEFSIWIFFWNTDMFPYEFFRHSDTICFRRKIEITLPRPLFIHKFFHYQKISEKQKGSFMKFSGRERQKVFDKSVIHPTPMHEKFLYQNSFEIHMCSPTNFNGTVKTNSREKTDILLSCINFSITEIFWNTEKIH